KGPKRGGFCFRKHFTRGSSCVIFHYQITVGESHVSESVVRIAVDRLLELFDRLPDSIRGALVPIVAALQIEFVRLLVLGVTLGHAGFVGARELESQVTGYLARDL